MRYIIFFLILLYNVDAYSQNKIDRAYFVDLLQKKKYSQVFNEAMQKRNEVYGKCAIVDYFIAKSLCLDGHKAKSVEWLQYIKKNYPLKTEAKRFIDNELRSCSRPSGTVDLSIAASYSMPLPQAGVGGMMKSGMNYRCYNSESSINFENLVLESDLESRLFAKNESQLAIAKLKGLLGNDYSVASNSRYIIVAQRSMHISEDDVREVTGRLDKAYTFFTSYYQLRPPDKLITVYLSPDNISLGKTAKLVHEINIPGTLLGYSLLADLSLSGISDPTRVGTLYHELFHLLVRTDIGDIPAWVDEGLASLYSTSSWKNNDLVGGHTWRLMQLQPAYLRKTRVSVPSIATLIEYNWEDFNGGENNNLCRASVNYALSNFFMLYLQEKKLLKPLVSFYKQRNGPMETLDSSGKTDKYMVEQLLKNSIDDIQRNFDDWFAKKYKTTSNRPGDNNNVEQKPVEMIFNKKAD